MKSQRPYSMTLRAQRAEETKQRILEAARSLFSTPSGGFTLDQVAANAGVSVQTVLRAFGSKDGLMASIVGSSRSSRRPAEPVVDDPGAVVSALYDDYEEIGLRVINMLAQEHRVPELAQVLRNGREDHRHWVEQAFGPRLKTLRGPARSEATVALVAATDVYVWKLLRIDLKLDRKVAEAIVRRLVLGAFGQPTARPKGS